MARKPYLINQMLKFYLLASILSTAVMNLNALIDSILMGQFLGTSALSAITLSNPVQLILNAFSLLLTSGATVLISKAFGEKNTESVGQSYTVVIISHAVFAVLSFASAFLFAGPITSLLCVEPSLTQLTHDYIFMQLLIGGILVFNSSLALLTDVAGKPQLGAKAMIIQCVVNIICDTLYVRVLGGGIMFASLATGTGALVSMIYMLRFILSKESPYHMVFHGYKAFALLGQHVVNGLSGMIIQISMTLLSIICNYFIQVNLGANGMFVQSIGFQAITIGFIVANGVGNGLLTLGSLLSGEHDLNGLHMLFRSCVRIVLIGTGIFMIALFFFAPQLAALFGSTDPDQIAMAQEGLPFVVTFLPGLNLAVIMSMTMLIGGYAVLSQVMSVSILVALGLSFFLMNSLFSNVTVWIAYPLTSVMIILLVFLLTELQRRKKRSELQMLSLLPRIKENDNLLDLSIACSAEGVREGTAAVDDFLRKKADPVLQAQACSALRGMLDNTVQNGGCPAKSFIDVRLEKNTNDLSMSIRDMGKPFDPTLPKTGLTAVREATQDAGYRYAFHQNNVVLRWKV